MLITAGAAAQPPGSLVLDFVLNGRETGIVAPVRLEAGTVLVRQAEWQDLGFRDPGSRPVALDGVPHRLLSAMPGLDYDIDGASGVLEITCAASCFPPTAITVSDLPPPPPAESGFGAFVNYDVTLDLRDDHATAETFEPGFGAFTEAGVFTPFGFGRNTYAIRNVPRRPEFIRLESAWTVDFPRSRLRLNLGDGITRGPDWALPSRFAGVQVGTEFSLQPGFVTFPTPRLEGAASLPATYELFVDDVLRHSGDMAPGPFSIGDIPAVDGRGNVRLVVTDVLGREQIIERPYYASRALLKEGLDSFSFAGGVLRRDFGLPTSHYDEAPFGTAAYRRGIAPDLTLGGYAEGTADFLNAGFGARWFYPEVGQFTGSAAFGMAEGEPDALFRIGFERTTPDLNVSTSLQYTTSGFRQIGLPPGQAAPRLLATGSIGLPGTNLGRFALSYAGREMLGARDTRIVNATYSIGLPDIGNLSINGFRTLAPVEDMGIGLLFTLPLGDRRTATAFFDYRGDAPSGGSTFRQTPPPDGGFGYRATVHKFVRDHRYEAGVTYDGEYGVVDLDASRTAHATAIRLGGRGGFTFFDQSLFAAKTVANSFAVVDAGAPGVGVYRGQQLIGRTNEAGRLYVGGLHPYAPNRLAIEVEDLPPNMRVETAEKEIVPRFRSGVAVRFALEHIPVPRGKPARANAIARARKSKERETPAVLVAAPGEGPLADILVPPTAILKKPASTCSGGATETQAPAAEQTGECVVQS